MSASTNHINTGPLVIHVGRQSDGYAYELHPRSRRRIAALFPEAHLVSSLFVGEDTEGALQQDSAILRQVATLLTGLNPDQIEGLGGVVLYDPATNTRSPLALAS